MNKENVNLESIKKIVNISEYERLLDIERMFNDKFETTRIRHAEICNGIKTYMEVISFDKETDTLLKMLVDGDIRESAVITKNNELKYLVRKYFSCWFFMLHSKFFIMREIKKLL